MRIAIGLPARQSTCADSAVKRAGAHSDDHHQNFSPFCGASTLSISTLDGQESAAIRTACACGGSDNSPIGNVLAKAAAGLNAYATPGALVAMSDQSLAPAGGDQPHNNMQPYLTFYFCIALQGVFPPRT